MRDIFLSGNSALSILLSPAIKDFEPPTISDNYMAYLEGIIEFPPEGGLSKKAPQITNQEVESLLEWVNLSRPLEVHVDSKVNRRNSKKLLCTLHPICAPQGWYFTVDGELNCALPELVLVDMATRCNDIELIVLMSLLCSVFTYNHDSGNGLTPRHKLLSREKIRKSVEICLGEGHRATPGLKRIDRLLQYVPENAASPKEIECALRLGLPQEMGGCGFGLPHLNYPLKISHSTRTRYCDLYWPDQNVCVEYNSDSDHLDPESLNEDALHQNDLVSIGIPVFVLTNGQLKSSRLFERTSKQIANALESPKLPQSALFHEKQRNLKTEIDAAFKLFGF